MYVYSFLCSDVILQLWLSLVVTFLLETQLHSTRAAPSSINIDFWDLCSREDVDALPSTELHTYCNYSLNKKEIQLVSFRHTLRESCPFLSRCCPRVWLIFEIYANAKEDYSNREAYKLHLPLKWGYRILWLISACACNGKRNGSMRLIKDMRL
jgi:hypothetical protein